MTTREQQVLALIRDDALISQQAIAEQLGISRSAVAGHIMKLTNKGIIAGRAYVINDAPFVAVIGGMNMDIHGRPEKRLRQQDSNPGTVTMSPGGVARNIAENLVRLHTDCRLVSAVGDDANGRALLRHCRDVGIDLQHVRTLDSLPTSTYLSILDSSGDMHVAVNDMAITNALAAEDLQSIAASLQRASLLVMDTNIQADVLAWVAEQLPEQTLFVDTVSATKSIKIKPYLQAIHTLKANRDEAEALSGMATGNKSDRMRLAQWFHDKGVKRLFVTMGTRGVFYSDGITQGLIKPPAVNTPIRNTGGAGDAFLAGLVHAWLQKLALRESVEFGMAAAYVTLLDDNSSSSALSITTINQALRKYYDR